MVSRLATVLDAATLLPVISADREMLPDAVDGVDGADDDNSKLSNMIRILRNADEKSDSFRQLMEMVSEMISDTSTLPVHVQINLSNLYDRLAGSLLAEPKKYTRAAFMSTCPTLAWCHLSRSEFQTVLLTRLSELCVETWTDNVHKITMPAFLDGIDRLSTSIFQRDVTRARQLHQSVWLWLARRFTSDEYLERACSVAPASIWTMMAADEMTLMRCSIEGGAYAENQPELASDLWRTSRAVAVTVQLDSATSAVFLWSQMARQLLRLTHGHDDYDLNAILDAVPSPKHLDAVAIIGMLELMLELGMHTKDILNQVLTRLDALDSTMDTLPPIAVYRVIFRYRFLFHETDTVMAVDAATMCSDLLRVPWPWPCCRSRNSLWYSSQYHGLGYHFKRLADDIHAIFSAANQSNTTKMQEWLRRS